MTKSETHRCPGAGMMSLRAVVALLLLQLASSACTQIPRIPYKIDAHVVHAANRILGAPAGGRQPVLRIRSGQTVSIDTVSHQGIINNMDPSSSSPPGA